MTGYMISLSALTAAVILIRAVFRRTVSPRVIYALWLVVVIRMIVPVALFSVDVKLPEFFRLDSPGTEAGNSAADVSYTADKESPENGSSAAVIISEPVTGPATSVSEDERPAIREAEGSGQNTAPGEISLPTDGRTAPDWRRIALTVWMCGSAAAALWISLTGFSFMRRLRRERVLYRTVGGTKVYISSAAGVPCVAGIVPSVYITSGTAGGPGEQMVIAHELAHLRHGDIFWSLVRSFALVAFWWNPLIWAAAVLSRRDAEFACDDAVASGLDDEKKLDYAQMLLNCASGRQSGALGLGSAPIKERITMLTGKRRKVWICLIAAVILAVSAALCSFASVSLTEETDGRNSGDNVPVDSNENSGDIVTAAFSLNPVTPPEDADENWYVLHLDYGAGHFFELPPGISKVVSQHAYNYGGREGTDMLYLNEASEYRIMKVVMVYSGMDGEKFSVKDAPARILESTYFDKYDAIVSNITDDTTWIKDSDGIVRLFDKSPYHICDNTLLLEEEIGIHPPYNYRVYDSNLTVVFDLDDAAVLEDGTLIGKTKDKEEIVHIGKDGTVLSRVGYDKVYMACQYSQVLSEGKILFVDPSGKILASLDGYSDGYVYSPLSYRENRGNLITDPASVLHVGFVDPSTSEEIDFWYDPKTGESGKSAGPKNESTASPIYTQGKIAEDTAAAETKAVINEAFSFQILPGSGQLLGD